MSVWYLLTCLLTIACLFHPRFLFPLSSLVFLFPCRLCDRCRWIVTGYSTIGNTYLHREVVPARWLYDRLEFQFLGGQNVSVIGSQDSRD